MAEVNLNNLKTEKKILKSRFTKFKNYFDKIKQNELSNAIIKGLQDRLEKFESIHEEYLKINLNLELIGEIEEIEDLEQFEDGYFELTGEIKAFIENFYNQCSERHSEIGSVRSNANLISETVKLPPIQLPRFDGQYSSWFEFRDAFVGLIDRNTQLTDYQKFYYLRQALSPEALKTIKSFTVTSANYSIAWSKLVERYENENLIIHSHIQDIFDCPPVVKDSSASLRNLYEQTTNNLLALKALGENVESWDRLIIFILVSKFDPTTKREWESYALSGKKATMHDIELFIKNKCEVLEKISGSKDNRYQIKKISTAYVSSSTSHSALKCSVCQMDHKIYSCERFLNLSTSERWSKVKENKLCNNCLKPGHPFWKCKSKKCFKCKKAHNSLLHYEKPTADANVKVVDSEVSTPDKSENSESNIFCAAASDIQNRQSVPSFEKSNLSQVLLATAIIKIKNIQNEYIDCRALLDSGSQSNFISEKLVGKLGISYKPVDFGVRGIGETLKNINKQVCIDIKSRINDFKTSLNCLIIENITENLPLVSFDKQILNIPDVKLADPKFNEKLEIDLLIGSGLFWKLLCVGSIQLGANMPTLRKTHLGWIVAGDLKIPLESNNTISCLNTMINFNSDSLSEQMTRFWNIEEVENKSQILSSSEQYCEDYFRETTSRDESGRFVVKIPFNEKLNSLGESRQMAINRFKSLEKKLNKNPDIKESYVQFMNDYYLQGHMSKIKERENDYLNNFYLPHHAVIKTQSLTTRLRVVFDASAKTDTGVSLNDTQFTGPKLQKDLFEIILRFRQYKYVLTGDISKMYRQVIIDETERRFQRILWRSSPEENLDTYELNTVTYGMAASSYLAVKCLHQLSEQFKYTHPVASNIIKDDFYIDDLITGANSKVELLNIQKDVTKILHSAGFDLRKWLSNDIDVLKNIELNKELEVSVLPFGENQPSKTLGIVWDAQTDFIMYSMRSINNNRDTKRSILSAISQIFDPLGLLGPFIIRAKLLMQQMWSLNIPWDDTVPEELQISWAQFKEESYLLKNVKIPRHVLSFESISVELHVFSDASEKAYGSAVFIRCVRLDGKVECNLLCAKSRVAPLKKITLPRLELCAALLAARLANKVVDALKVKFNKQYYYSDSTITLAWVKGEPSRWKTFVANRVSEIQSLTDKSNWYHVNSGDNAADILSRGSSIDDLISNNLWWHGPQWFSNDSSNWKLTDGFNNTLEIPEIKMVSTKVVSVIQNELAQFLINRFSSFSKLLRITAYIIRFCKNVKGKRKDSVSKTTTVVDIVSLSPEEINEAEHFLLKVIQMNCFSMEYECLKNNKPLHKKSSLLSLKPFLMNDLIRVGGRLNKAQQPFDKKYPIILPKSHALTDLILTHEHERMFHCGVQLLLSNIREKYWPVSSRHVCKKIIKKCIVCIKAKPKGISYLMGDLPDVRVNTYSPFLNVGMDFGGPFMLKDRKTRSPKLIKAYLCLFICLSTKAVHLDLLTDLTSEAFIAVFKRFISRRGKPANIYSDNGTNFVGANKELLNIYRSLKKNRIEIANNLSSNFIKWHFIPARAPSFGGIWESGIKSVKFHLKRVIGNNFFNYEDFLTILVQIEGILNSRPLSPLTADPEDYVPLTPGHFLIGRSLQALPEPSIIDVPVNRLRRFQHLQSIVQHYWSRWQKEYLSQLQFRTKWKTKYPELIRIGSLVLVQGNNDTFVNDWQLARVIGLHPGEDGVLRVVDLRTRGGEIRRPLSKICVLPVEPEQ